MMQAYRAHMVTYFRYFDSDGAYKQFYDYQGNVRSVVTGWDAQEILSTDYYPYGLPMATSTSTDTNRYKYSANELVIGLPLRLSKETHDGINLNHFDARFLLSDLGYMNRPDPRSAEYPMYNPYLYCAANPIKYIDPSGETIIAYEGNKRIWFGFRNGDLVVTDDDGNQIDYNDSIRIAYGNVTIGSTYFTYSPLPIYVISSYWISKILNSK